MSNDSTDTHNKTKRCGKCGDVKPTSEFGKHALHKDGLQSCCKKCKSSIDKIYRTEHLGEIAAYQVVYRAGHIAETKIYNADYRENHRQEAERYRQDNREKIAHTHSQYRQSHRDEIAQYHKDNREKELQYHAMYRQSRRGEIASRVRTWQKNNPEKCRANTNLHRARKLGNGGTHTAADIQRQGECQKWKCWWCGKDCKEKYHIDHLVPLAKGGHNNPSNIVISCPTCNLKKNDKMPDEFSGRLL